MAATPKPVRKMAKQIKKEHRKTREGPYVTTYAKANQSSQRRKEKNLPLSSVKGAAQYRLKQKKK